MKKRADQHTHTHTQTNSTAKIYSPLKAPVSGIVKKTPFQWHIFFFFFFSSFTETVKFHLAGLPPVLLLAICGVQHRMLPQAVPFERSKSRLMTNDFPSRLRQ